MRPGFGILLIAAALAACDSTTEAPLSSRTQSPIVDDRDVQLRSYLRSRFAVSLPPDFRMDGGQGSTDYAIFTVQHTQKDVLTVYVGDWAFEQVDQEHGFRDQFGGQINKDSARERLIALTQDGRIRAILIAMPGTREYLAREAARATKPFDPSVAPEPPPAPRYILIEILAGLTVEETIAAESIAQSVRPLAQAPPA